VAVQVSSLTCTTWPSCRWWLRVPQGSVVVEPPLVALGAAEGSVVVEPPLVAPGAAEGSVEVGSPVVAPGAAGVQWEEELPLVAQGAAEGSGRKRCPGRLVVRVSRGWLRELLGERLESPGSGCAAGGQGSPGVKEWRPKGTSRGAATERRAVQGW